MDEEQSVILVEDEMLRGGFTQIPNIVLRDPEIPFGAKVAYGVLLSYAWQKGSCFPGQETMAADMGVTDRSVRTYLDQLEEIGLISVKRIGLGKTNTYVILSTSRWKNIPVTERKPVSGQTGSHVPVRSGSLLPTNKTQENKTQENKTHSLARAENFERTASRNPEQTPPRRDNAQSMTSRENPQARSSAFTAGKLVTTREGEAKNPYIIALGRLFHPGKTAGQLTDPAWEELQRVAAQLARTGDAPEEIALRAARWNKHYPSAGAITKTALLKHWDLLANDPPRNPTDRSWWEHNGMVYARENEQGQRTWPSGYRPTQAEIHCAKILDHEGNLKDNFVA